MKFDSDSLPMTDGIAVEIDDLNGGDVVMVHTANEYQFFGMFIEMQKRDKYHYLVMQLFLPSGATSPLSIPTNTITAVLLNKLSFAMSVAKQYGYKLVKDDSVAGIIESAAGAGLEIKRATDL